MKAGREPRARQFDYGGMAILRRSDRIGRQDFRGPYRNKRLGSGTLALGGRKCFANRHKAPPALGRFSRRCPFRFVRSPHSRGSRNTPARLGINSATGRTSRAYGLRRCLPGVGAATRAAAGHAGSGFAKSRKCREGWSARCLEKAPISRNGARNFPLGSGRVTLVLGLAYGDTVIVAALLVMLPIEAVMVTVPPVVKPDTPDTRPADTVARLVLLEVQVATLVTSCDPLQVSAVAVSGRSLPPPKLTEPLVGCT